MHCLESENLRLQATTRKRFTYLEKNSLNLKPTNKLRLRINTCLYLQPVYNNSNTV